MYCTAYSETDLHAAIYLALVTLVPDGNTMRHRPVAQILTINAIPDLDTVNYKAVMSINLAHEVAHTMGLREIYSNYYGDATNHAGDEGMQCIMELVDPDSISSLWSSIYNEEAPALCDYCINKLNTVMYSDAFDR
ncbi:MAG: hypothetical protein J6L24_07365 [Oscillospiraceae bacterium]|nr:hypothetical protein [Oscillospiraceae bacterium]